MFLLPRCAPLWFLLFIWTRCMWLVRFKAAVTLEKDRWRRASGERTTTYAGCHSVQYPRLAVWSSIYVAQYHFYVYFMCIDCEVRYCEIVYAKPILPLALLLAAYRWPLLFFWAQQKYLASQVMHSVSFSYLTFVFCSQGISSFYRSERQIRSDKPLSRAPFSLFHSLPLMPARFVLRRKVRVQFLLFIPIPVQLKKLSSCVCADAFLFVPQWEL